MTDANFDAILSKSKDPLFLEFYAPWCGHCKALAPKWKNVASELKGRVRVGAVNCDENRETCGKYGIQGFPTLKFLSGTGGSKVVDYNGPREESDLVTFATNEWSNSRPPPEVRELTSRAVMDEECLGHTLCFVAFLPHILDSRASGRNEYLKMLKTLAKTYKDRPWGYVWAEAGALPDLEAALEATFGTPSFFAVSPGKNKFSNSRSGFSAASLKEFVDSVRAGREPVKPCASEIGGVSVKTRAKWDGKDGELEVEEEFSLEDLGM